MGSGVTVVAVVGLVFFAVAVAAGFIDWLDSLARFESEED